MKKISNELSDIDIKKILDDRDITINGIYMKDQLPHQLKIGFYIINLQSSTEGKGTHWTCLYYYPSMSIYFDSFGFVPPMEVEEKINKYIYNSRDLQNYNDTSCGFFCISFIIFLYNKKISITFSIPLLDCFIEIQNKTIRELKK